uniref:RNA polymerase sigma-70 domain-containing protein n=1 Tax=Prasinoderma coloniale TaxID=156133 RepID=A0A7R9TJ76_9VIRI
MAARAATWCSAAGGEAGARARVRRSSKVKKAAPALRGGSSAHALASWATDLELDAGEVAVPGGARDAAEQASGADASAAGAGADDIASLLAEAQAAMRAYAEVDRAVAQDGAARPQSRPDGDADDDFKLPAAVRGGPARSARARAPKAADDLPDFVVLPPDERGPLAHLPKSFAALLRVSMGDLRSALAEASVPAAGIKGDLAETVLVARGELPLYQRPLRAMGLEELRHVSKQAGVDVSAAAESIDSSLSARSKAAKEAERGALLTILIGAVETEGLALNARELEETVAEDGDGAGKAQHAAADADAEAARVAAVRSVGLPVGLAARGGVGGAGGGAVGRRRRSGRKTASQQRRRAPALSGGRVAAVAVAPSPNVADRRPLTAAEEEQAAKVRSAVSQQNNEPIKAFMANVSNDGLLTAQEEVELSQGIAELVRLRKARLRACRAVGLLPKAKGAGAIDEDDEPTARGRAGRELRALREEAFARLDDASWAAHAELSVEELHARFEHGTRCRERMINANQRLVFSVAKRYQGQGLTLEDLIIEGTFGLIRGAEKFDGSKGFKFSTYATWWVRQSVTRALADQGRIIRLPVHLVELLQRVNRIRREETERTGVEPSTQWLAKEVGVPKTKLESVLAAAEDTMSLDQEIGGRGGGGGSSASVNGGRSQTIMDQAVTEDAQSQDGDGGALSMMMREDIESVLNTLAPRERDVLRLRYGLEDGVMHTLEDIGDAFALTRERIRQIEAKALRKLRQPTRSGVLREYVSGSAAASSSTASPAEQAQQRRKLSVAAMAGSLPKGLAGKVEAGAEVVVPVKRGRGRPRKVAAPGAGAA